MPGTAVPALPTSAATRGGARVGLFLEFTSEVGRGAEYMRPRRLTRSCPLPLYLLPAYVVLYWSVLGPLEPAFENGHGVE